MRCNILYNTVPLWHGYICELSTVDFLISVTCFFPSQVASQVVRGWRPWNCQSREAVEVLLVPGDYVMVVYSQQCFSRKIRLLTSNLTLKVNITSKNIRDLTQYVTSSYSIWIFCRGVSGFATDCPCGVWCRGLTTIGSCMLVNLLEIDFLNNSWAVGLT